MKSWIGILAFLFLLSCGKDKQVSKGIWDETENGMTVRVSDQAGKPVKGAKVRVIPIEEWSQQVSLGNSPVRDSAIADAAGTVHLVNSTWPAALEVELGNQVGRLVVRGIKDSQKVVVENGRALSGKLKNLQGSFPAFVHIAGSTSKSIVTATGEFHFPSLPSGDLLLVAEDERQFAVLQSVSIEGSEDVFLDSVPVLLADEILLDDFSDKIPANQFHYLTGGGWWYSFADSGSVVSPSDPKDALENGSLHVTFTPDVSRPTAFAMVGFDLNGSVLEEDISKASHDLSQMDSICFDAQGYGQVIVQSVGLDSLGVSIHTDAVIQLSTSWATYCLRPMDFDDWAKIGTRVTGFAFVAQSNAELWLDRIVLHGLAQGELFP